tara:strand:- start:650 stop:1252 length:603 start_codon:yes stop_codon:yes gene_type:complete
MKVYQEISVDKDSIIFDTINAFHVNFPQIMAIRILKSNKFIGYELMLNKKFSDYEEFNEDTLVLYCYSFMDYNCKTKDIKYPLIYQRVGMMWPPSDNWYTNDPINLSRFLIWNGFGNGPLDVPKEKDNSYHNLIVLGYNDIKKTVNKYSYLKYVFTNDGKDLLTNNKLDTITLLKLSEVLYLKQSNDKVLENIHLSFTSN